MNEAAAAGEEVLARGAGGAMLYDASCLHHPDTAVFDRSHWQARGTLETTQGGRGTVAFVRTRDGQRWVLRHYRRGGLIARLVADRYLWTGAEQHALVSRVAPAASVAGVGTARAATHRRPVCA